VSDFIGGVASRRVAALRVVLVSYPVAMVLLTIIAVTVGGHVSPPAVAWGSLCGISQAFGVWWFYAALGAGPISVVSPLTAVLVSAVPVAVGLALGERPSGLAVVGIALAFVAVILVSREVADEPLARRESSADEPLARRESSADEPLARRESSADESLARRESSTDEDSAPHRFTTKVAWLTVGSGLAFGLNFVVIHQAPVDARIWPLVFARMSASALVLVIALFTRNLKVPRGVPLRLALTAGVLDTVSIIAMLLALQASLLSLASVLMSLYPVATVALAMVVLKERATRWQASGAVLALVSVALIAGG
jgi:drug/metabolite transporter (DMT)-like permease